MFPEIFQFCCVCLQMDCSGHEARAEDPSWGHATPGHLPALPQRHQAAAAGRPAAAAHRQVDGDTRRLTVFLFSLRLSLLSALF